MDVGCYCVNAARTLVGDEPIEAIATARWTERGVDDELTGILRFPGDVTAHFDASLTMERCEFYEVAGTDGHLRGDSAFLPGTGDVEIEEHRGRAGVTPHPVVGADEYLLMVEHFAACVLDGGPVRYPAAEAAANMRAIEALYRSARAGGRGWLALVASGNLDERVRGRTREAALNLDKYRLDPSDPLVGAAVAWNSINLLQAREFPTALQPDIGGAVESEKQDKNNRSWGSS